MPAKAVRKAAPKPKLTVEDYRKLLGDVKKSVVVVLSAADLSGTLAQVTARLTRKAKAAGLEDWKLVGTESRGNYYDYARHEYRKNTQVKIVGTTEYTDEELVKKGAALVAQKIKADAKAERERAANLKKFNDLAEKLGYEPVTGE